MPIQRLAVISFDVEQDCPPYLSSWRGVEEGLPRLLDLLAEEKVRATFFSTGEFIERYPRLARRILDEGHELGLHGYRHERLDRLPPGEAARAIEKAAAAARRVAENVASFRAPNLRLPRVLYPVLKRNGLLYDSSLAAYKPPFQGRPTCIDGVLVIPASVTSSVLRLPWRLQKPVHKALGGLRVYFSHPWEYVDMTRERVRLDCRFNTGEKALELLRRLVAWLRENGFQLQTLREAGEEIRGRTRCEA